MSRTRNPVDDFVRHLNAFTDTLSKVVSDGTDFGNFPEGLTSDLLDSAEEKLDLAASYMRTIKNSRQLACKLPREVLDLIFAYTMFRFRDFDPFPARPGYGGQWHPSILSGVCRYWRAVAISCPAIWSTIYLSDSHACASLSFAQLSLRRSYGSLLNVYIDYQAGIPDIAMNWISEDLVAQSIRFSGFHIREHRRHFSGALYEVLSECPAPDLQSLTLQPDTLPASVAPDPLLFAGFLPSIKRLTTSRLRLWPSYRLTTLTHICFRESAFTVPEILDLLSCNPALEVLVLQSNESSTQDADDNSSLPTIGISLPHLRRLDLTNYAMSSCARILNAIRPPPQLNLTIDYVRPAPSHTLLSTISRLSLVSTITTLVLRSSSYPARLSIAGAGQGAFAVAPGADVHEAGSNQYMAGLLALLAACPVRELVIDGDGVVTRVALWQRIFLAAPLVARLVIVPGNAAREPSGMAFLDALCAPDETLGAALPCPLLKELTVRGTTQRQRSPGSPHASSGTKHLQQFLSDRRSRGFPVRKVVLEDYFPPSDILAEMKRLVDTVDLVNERRPSTSSDFYGSILNGY
ncbi:hypothetical protein PsYK624_004950 [Phanerochaete sordida]|uniref:F-box domain-containing protein n=1 Tax=Phanerochaete sordida TaxID=48140 RepID=A0A9P3FY26_9APHY|nr:hypothetical protein PsYK624_004950 [Phanerochaete sordida]